MERVGIAVFDCINTQLTDEIDAFNKFCGKGNKGGDGLVIAYRLLQQKANCLLDVAINMYILDFGNPGTDCFQTNLSRLHSITNTIHFIHKQ